MDQHESPTERFKRVISQATRALSAEPETEVKFGGDRPSIDGKEARLPLPPRRLDKKKVAVSRGHADSAALKLAHHDPDLHRQLQPMNVEGQGLFQALEDMRCEALGTRALKGVGDNLDAALDRKLDEKGYRRMEDRQDVPIQDIVQLLARERMTGRPVPKSAEKLVDLWREEIENTCGEALDGLTQADAFVDQSAFSELARQVIEALDLGDKQGDQDQSKEEEDAPPDEGEQPEMQEEESQEDDDAPDADDQPQDQSPDFGEANDGEADIQDDPQSLDDGDMREDAGDDADSE